MEAGKCAVCQEPASQACAHCGTISYCGKEHQKEHWASHKNVCKPYRIQESEDLGRCGSGSSLFKIFVDVTNFILSTFF